MTVVHVRTVTLMLAIDVRDQMEFVGVRKQLGLTCQSFVSKLVLSFNVTKMHFLPSTLQIGHQHHSLAYNNVGDRLACHQHLLLTKCH